MSDELSRGRGFRIGTNRPGTIAADTFMTDAVRRAAMIMMAVTAVVIAIVTSVALPLPAHAAGAKVSTSVEGGTLHPDSATTVDLSGSRFQSVQGGFGGIYVLFGWVSDPNGDSWKPSKGGVTGETYRYVPDDENNPTGYDVFVAFPGDSTASAANGGQLAADGTWHAKITVPGAKFTSVDRSGNPVDVDCTAVQCGIITIGAHGVANSTNETFTPMTFATASDQQSQNDQSADGSTESNDQNADQTQSADTANGDANADAKNGTADNTSTNDAAAADDNAANDNAATTAAGATTERNGMTNVPTWGIAGWLIMAAVIILGISIIVLAAGVGGYLAAKSLLLGISPAALDREAARRERKAASVRAREEIRTAKHRRRLHERVLKEQAKADKAQAMAEGNPSDFAVPSQGDSPVNSTANSAVAQSAGTPSIFVPGGGLRGLRSTGSDVQETQTLPIVDNSGADDKTDSAGSERKES
ncbi:CDF family cation diffusion facilitator [Bifidobacterium tissieri]|uniref:CDF family cation diffusion facilitator n=1 Tax=Bifidobacterium tissieri TaxID=1630162 RepID=A0A261FDE8_9BIFI|nr:hypothetical protein [Bifidobacterium tissieri]OZG57157.1 CDF family cation diffusion facilitator [Bifidobacterium tissieri]